MDTEYQDTNTRTSDQVTKLLLHILMFGKFVRWHRFKQYANLWNVRHLRVKMLRLRSTGMKRRAHRLSARPHVMAYRKKCKRHIYGLPSKKILVMGGIIFLPFW